MQKKLSKSERSARIAAGQRARKEQRQAMLRTLKLMRERWEAGLIPFIQWQAFGYVFGALQAKLWGWQGPINVSFCACPDPLAMRAQVSRQNPPVGGEHRALCIAFFYKPKVRKKRRAR